MILSKQAQTLPRLRCGFAVCMLALCLYPLQAQWDTLLAAEAL